jgi:hypothetical protein
MVRVILGFVAAALWLPLLFLLVEGGNYYGRVWFSMVAAFTIPLTLFAAVPLFYFWRSRITFWRCLLAGVGLGLVGAAAFLLMTNPTAAANWFLGMVGAGVLSSMIFWFIAVWNNGALAKPDDPGVGNAAI